MKKGIIRDLKGTVSAGKEARVYLGKGRKGEDLAVKIYLTSAAEFRKGIIKYIRGDPRFEGALPKSFRKLMILWARKEFKNYVLMHRAGASVPKPLAHHENVLVMEFIGEEGVRAPLLKEVRLDYGEYEEIFWRLMKDVKRIYRDAGLVHGDLSEFNVMVWEGKHYIIDVSQAVKVAHPNALNYLRRDLYNLWRFFSKEVGLDIPTPEELFRTVTEG